MQIFKKILTVIFTTLAVFAATNLLYSAWCAFTWGKFTLFDYGIYTNMIWNSGHGEPFKILVNDSYLSTHLSFTLALIGPFFHVWDHPFLLSFLQWLMMVAGGIIILITARKSNVPAVVVAALLFFFLGYRLTQGVMLSEFHTVGAYFLLVPWLYYCCRFSKHTAWLPLLLILGVREDAFLLLLPMLLYFAVKDKWKAGYILLGVAVAYGFIALFYLYPAINGMSILDRRGSIISKVVAGAFDRRIHTCLWTILPVLAFIHWKSWPSLFFPSVALISTLASGYPTQQGMGSHYGANVMVCLAVGLLETAILRCRDGSYRSGVSQLDMTLRAILLAGVVLLFHANSGFIFAGGNNNGIYKSPSSRGELAICAIKKLPRDGMLVADHDLAGFCANRSDFLTWKRLRPDKEDFDVVFTEARRLSDRLWHAVQRGEFGFIYFDGEFVILQKDVQTPDHQYILDCLKYGTILPGLTPMHGGETFIQDDILVRHWGGRGIKAPITISYGGRRFLEPGSYEAVFRYKAKEPVKKYQGNWGWFSVHYLNDQGLPLAKANVREVAFPDGEYQEQCLAFVTSKATNIEVRVTGGDAELWLGGVTFFKAQECK